MSRIKGWSSVKHPGASIRRWTNRTLDGNRSISGSGGYGISRSQVDIIRKNGEYVVEVWVNPDMPVRSVRGKTISGIINIQSFSTLKEAESYAVNYMRRHPNG